MPVVEVSTSDTERIDLTTCPGGYVVLRRMSYDEVLERRDMSSRIKLEGTQNQNRRRAYGEQSDNSALIEMANKVVTEWEFQRLILEHNLDMKDGSPFNFKVPGILQRLDPKVGDEIAYYIGQMNNFEPSLAKGENPQEDGPLHENSGSASSGIVKQLARPQT